MKHLNNLKFSYLASISLLLIFLFVGNITHGQNQLTVKPVNPTSNPLIDSLVGSLVGTGIRVENIRSNLKQTSKAMGTFKAPKQLFGIKEGLMMVTGDIAAIPGQNSFATISNPIPPTDTIANCSEGRQMLNSVIAYNNQTTTVRRAVDCATIQFDVIPSADSIKFNYVFGSEEYNEFVCSQFNDIFGFFIKGPGIVGDASLDADFPGTRNLAVIPGTDLPVSINTVNNGTDADPDGLCTFTPEGIASFVDNEDDVVGDPFIFPRIKFDGLTVVLTAAVKVIPCQTYTLTLTIADVVDGSWDSGVFIEKGSLRSGLTTTASSVYSTRFPYSIINCNPGTFIVKREFGDVAQKVSTRYTIGGTAINGVDYVQRLKNGSTQPLVDSVVLYPGMLADTITIVGLDGPNWTQSEQKFIKLKFLNSLVPYFNGLPNYCGDSSQMIIRKRFLYNAGPDRKICQFGDTLLKPLSTIVPSDIYRWRALTASGDTIVPQFLSCDTCEVPRASDTITTRYVVYVFDSISGCVTNDTVVLNVYNNPTLKPVTDKPGNKVCKGESIRLIANLPNPNPNWKYKWKKPLFANNDDVDPDSLNALSLLIINHNVPQYYVVTSTNEIGCSLTDSIQVQLLTKPIFSLPLRDTVQCKEMFDIVPLTLSDTGQTTFRWSVINTLGQTNLGISTPTATIQPTQSGFYVLTAKNSCVPDDATDTTHITVLYQDPFTIISDDTVCYGTQYKIALKDTGDVTGTEFSWSSLGQRVTDSHTGNLEFKAKAPSDFILNGKNVCYNLQGFVNDTLHLFVFDSTSAHHEAAVLGDSLTSAPVQFTSHFFPPTYSRTWGVKNLDTGWDTTLVGLNPSIVISQGGQIESKAVVFKQFGTRLCKDEQIVKFDIEPLGTVFVPNVLSDNRDGLNDFFTITARDKDGNKLREIKNGKVTVYNRWGKKVYENTNYNNTLNAEEIKEGLTDGIYFFEYKNERYNYKNGGWFRIVRE